MGNATCVTQTHMLGGLLLHRYVRLQPSQGLCDAKCASSQEVETNIKKQERRAADSTLGSLPSEGASAMARSQPRSSPNQRPRRAPGGAFSTMRPTSLQIASSLDCAATAFVSRVTVPVALSVATKQL